ncbi:peptidase M23 [Streptomyces sp. H10-C2]|uniref:peptidase M23 n=1 Tax=unclassified Streptomyces TaxID=2593676 RepID=UPI0024B982D7|nr:MULTISPECIES: peptidase M23 [unclassified Streptomyces]MDJ0345562.1 peptidase M23 [Streptomyces sp. PH10-H1]MDJ0374508.1 peptidase M23 [Streptomyces sp. H10-C2]
MEGADALRAAANVAGRGLMLKVGAVGAVCFLVFLLVVGIFGAGIGGKAFADGCGSIGQPGADLGSTGGNGAPDAPGEQTRADQIKNAQAIDAVAKARGLPGRATLVALMTALQESTLLNLDHGDRDSIGLFQQRPSQGWGTKEQIMKPGYAASMFFFGADSGSPQGLTDILAWPSMDLGAAAQAVQHSAYPDLYKGQEGPAREIAGLATIDLNRPGTEKGNVDQGTQGGTASGGTGSTECYTEGTPGKPGEPFHDGAAGWPPDVKNPRSTAEAIAWATLQATSSTPGWYRACLAFVANSQGWTFSGVPYAIDHYKEMPAAMKHDKDRNPPPGALMYWETGSRAGHVALYLGDGKIASNDIERPGFIDVVPATDIETKWGATYVGWAPPYFPKGG